jgi:F-type H+-transporting ATPase subunit delta
LSDSRLSRRYARALFSLGREDGSYDQYGRELKEFTAFYREHKDFEQAITNPVFAIEDRKEVLKVVLDKSGFSGLVKNFLNLLLDKNRIGAIEAITEHYTHLTDEISNIAHAEIISARPLREETLDRMVKSLAGFTSRDIKPDVKEDPEIIGGVIVKIGDLVLDGSIKAQLEGLKESFRRGE